MSSRRLLEAHQVAQLHQLQAQNGGLLFLSAYRQEVLRSSNNHSLEDGDTAKEERKRRVEEALKDTSFLVDAQDMVAGDGESMAKERDVSSGNPDQATTDANLHDNNTRMEDAEDEKVSGQATTNASLQDMEAQALAELEVTSVLRLPKKDGAGTSVEVPAVCAICLCGYEIEDSVTYSKCPHAFHTECIVQWLAKSNEGNPKCPCCRQVYCEIQPITFSDLANSSNSGRAENMATLHRTSTTRTLTPLEFMVAVRTGGSSLFFAQEQTQSADDNHNRGIDGSNDEDGQHSNTHDIEAGDRMEERQENVPVNRT
ncbi:MAG: hypothetical protein SGILL_004162 [Bacillariaceae sp.]